MGLLRADKNHSQSSTLFLTALRALATISVITFHIGNGKDTKLDIITRSIFSAINNWCVPVFFMITGVLYLCVKESIEPKKHLKKTVHLLILVLFWNFIYNIICIMIIENGFSFIQIYTALRMAVIGDTQYGYQLWYLYTAIGIYLTLPILKQWFDHATRDEIFFYAFLFSLFGMIVPSLTKLFTGSVKEVWNGAFSFFGGYLAYVLIGACLYRYRLTNKQKRILLTFGCGVLALYILLGLFNPEYLKRISSYNSISAAILSSAIFVFVQMIEWKKEKSVIWTSLSIIANHSLSIYLIHVMVVQALRKILHFSSEFAPLIISLPILTITVLGLSILVSCVAKKIPFIKGLFE